MTCQDCGARVVEPVGADLMPNTCVACFHRRVSPVFEGVPHFYPTAAALIAGLIEAGCKPTAVRSFITQLVQIRGWCDDR
jgi:hypothetical protein